jgi:hypothetical protein
VIVRDNLGRAARRHLAFTVVNTPDLIWEGGAGYEDDGVQPNRGAADDTLFRFRVKLRDADSDRPEAVELQLQQNGAAWRTIKLSGGEGSLRRGRVFGAELQLPAGEYRYRFAARDDDGEATGEPSEYRSAPRIVVEGATPASALFLSATAVPTPTGGAQISFALSAPATVEALVRNVAGRPVSTLSTGRRYEAGTHTLLWNGLSDGGLRVPSGMYLIELNARTEDGSQARRLAPLQR